MGLQIFWFSVIAIFWTGFFVLEGFDLGVGALHAVVGKTDVERRVAINTIGPFWDGNEVWLIVAGAGTFAAFPDWYATWFSAMYLALMLVLVGLIVRGVSFEFRNKIDTHRWKHSWTVILTVASAALPVLFGIALGDLLVGLPIDSDHEYTGTFWDLLTPYGIWVGITLLSLTLLHGTTFLNLRTTGIVNERARRLAPPAGRRAIVTVVVFATWTHVLSDRGIVPGPVQIIAVLAIVAAGWSVKDRHDGWAFTATAVAIGLTVAHDLHRPLPERDGLLDQLGEQPDGRPTRPRALLAEDHEHRGDRALPDRPRVPGLELLHVPPPHRRPRAAHRTGPPQPPRRHPARHGRAGGLSLRRPPEPAGSRFSGGCGGRRPTRGRP